MLPGQQTLEIRLLSRRLSEMVWTGTVSTVVAEVLLETILLVVVEVVLLLVVLGLHLSKQRTPVLRPWIHELLYAD
jgi:hypothetical protein